MRLALRIGLAALLPLIVATPGRAAPEPLYVAAVDVLSADGKYARSYLQSTGDGVSLAECELRKAVWLEQYGPGLEAAKAQLADQGKQTAFRIACERKP